MLSPLPPTSFSLIGAGERSWWPAVPDGRALVGAVRKRGCKSDDDLGLCRLTSVFRQNRRFKHIYLKIFKLDVCLRQNRRYLPCLQHFVLSLALVRDPGGQRCHCLPMRGKRWGERMHLVFARCFRDGQAGRRLLVQRCIGSGGEGRRPLPEAEHCL